MTRVLLVDDHALFRKGVRALLASIDDVDVEVVGEAQSGPEAVELAGRTQPDLVLLDLQMPDGGGLEALPGLLAAAPAAYVLVVTMRADDAAVRDALLLGARGYLLKDSDGEDFVAAVRAVARGDAYIGRELAANLTALLRGRTEGPAFPDLTERERAVLRGIALGRSNADIATDLFLSHKTVQNYVSRVFLKLGVADRSQAIVCAREAGLHLE